MTTGPLHDILAVYPESPPVDLARTLDLAMSHAQFGTLVGLHRDVAARVRIHLRRLGRRLFRQWFVHPADERT